MKLKREQKRINRDIIITKKRISGGIKQTINAHGCISEELISSATKRVYGALLDNKKKKPNYNFMYGVIIGFFFGIIFIKLWGAI